MLKTLDEIRQLVDKLVVHGESSDELSLWLEIYDTLPNEHKLELGQMLEEELRELEVSENKPNTLTLSPAT